MLKKAINILIAGILLSISANAQEKKESSTGSMFYFFNKAAMLIDNRDSAYFTRIMTPDSANSKLYNLEDVYSNGKTRLKGKSLTAGPYFKGQGYFERFYPGGQLQETATYENGHYAGKRMTFYADGKLQDSATYANGKLYGKRITYYPTGKRQFYGNYDGEGVAINLAYYFPNGKLYYTAVFDTAKKTEIIGNVYDMAGKSTAVNGNGTYAYYTDTFKRVFSNGPIYNGLKDGEWKGKLTDTLNTFVCVYDKGILVSGTTFERTGKVIHFTKEEIEPAPKGGLQQFYRDLASHVIYPKKAKENLIQGKVILSFVIGKDGDLEQIKVVSGIGGGCDEAAVEALQKTSNPWTPGLQYGLPVRVQYSLPLDFHLQF